MHIKGAGVRYNLHPHNITTPGLKNNCENTHPIYEISTPGVIIL